MSVDILRDLQAGKLSQTCPSCGLIEAAGAYCTACLARTGPDDWHADHRKRRSLPSGADAPAVAVSDDPEPAVTLQGALWR